jgi:DNA primase
VILTESVIDALSLIACGIPNAVPCYGVNGFSEEHAKLLTDERVKTVVIGFDNDEAGAKGAEKLKDVLVSQGFAANLQGLERGAGGRQPEKGSSEKARRIRCALQSARTKRIS